MLVVESLDYTERFRSDFKRLDAEMQQATRDCLAALLQTPIRKTLRHHTLNGYRPKIHKIDVTPNHAYQVTFEVSDGVAKLLRVGTHKQLDRAPR